MTHAEAVRKSAASHQRQSASFHADYDAHKSEGREFLARWYAQLAAEESALARALMGISVVRRFTPASLL